MRTKNCGWTRPPFDMTNLLGHAPHSYTAGFLNAKHAYRCRGSVYNRRDWMSTEEKILEEVQAIRRKLGA